MADIPMEPVVLIDKKRNKEAHIVIPVNNSFEDLLDAARRINTGLFQGEWELSYLNPTTKQQEPIDKDAEIATYTDQEINTFFWNYKASTFKSSFERRMKKVQEQIEREQQRHAEARAEYEANKQTQRQAPPKKRQVLGLRYANVGIRAAAFVIDMIILNVVGSIFGGDAFTSGLLFLFYFSIMESSSRQASLGKQFFGLRVTDYRGNTLSFGAALFRNVIKGIACIGLIGGEFLSTLFIFANIIVLFNTKHLSFHDQASKSIVLAEVDRKTRTS